MVLQGVLHMLGSLLVIRRFYAACLHCEWKSARVKRLEKAFEIAREHTSYPEHMGFVTTTRRWWRPWE